MCGIRFNTDNAIALASSTDTELIDCIQEYLSAVPDFTIISREELTEMLMNGVLSKNEKAKILEMFEKYMEYDYFDFETDQPITKEWLLKRMGIIAE